tara:strand:- start:752 stop:2065 length:1314 start_codon:yes stop_codon:yes gene_type:complete
MSKKKHIYLPIEIKAREYVSNLLIVSKAIDKGYRCYIGAKSSINRLASYKKEKDGIFFSKSTLTEKDYIYYRNKFEYLTILDQELGPALSFKEIKMGLHSSRDQIIPKYIDSYYVISENMKKLVKEIYPEIKEKIKLTGWPRIDLWKDFRYLSDDKIESIKKKYGKFILFSSDYSFTRKSNIYSFLKYLEEYNWSKDSTKYKFVKDQAYQTYNEFKKNINFFKKLDQLKLDYKIIIRPHPADDRKHWTRLSKYFKNILVIYEGDITEWLYASEGFFHRGCTTAVQAAIANISPVYLISDKKFIRETLTYEISDKINSIDEFLQYFKEKKFLSKDNQLKLKEYILLEEDISSCSLIIKDFESFDVNVSDPQKLGLLNFIKEFIFKIKNLIRKKGSMKIYKLGDGINFKETEELFFKIRKIKDFKLKKIFDNCLEIEKI